MPYLKIYVPEFDQAAQVEVSLETAAKAASAAGRSVDISDEPFPDCIVTSRYISQRLVKDGQLVDMR